MARVLRVLTRPNLGGPTRQAIALWHAHRELGVATLLVTGRVDAREDALSPALHGVPKLSFEAARQAGPTAAGWVEIAELGRGFGQPLRDRRARVRLAELVRAFRPDAVHTHTSKAGWLGRRAAFAAAVPVVVHTFHGHVLRDYFGPLLSRFLVQLERRLAQRTTHLLAVSDSCADELAALAVAPRARLLVVPPAVPTPVPLSRDEARHALGISAGEHRVVAVGRCVPIKRFGDFVTAVALDRELRGDLVGTGPELSALAAGARAAAGRVTLRGAVPDIAGKLAAYDALVLPSRREGCPLVAIEAFAAGIPVVGYDVAGVRDALAHWGRGLLVPESAGPAGLLAAVRRLRAEPGLAGECIRASRAGLERFRPAAVADRLAALYSP